MVVVIVSCTGVLPLTKNVTYYEKVCIVYFLARFLHIDTRGNSNKIYGLSLRCETFNCLSCVV